MNSSYYIEILERHEASSVRFLENIVWESANGYHIFDADGKKYIDFSSGTMITNSGHNNREIIDAMIEQLKTGIYSTYLFPNKPRAELHKLLSTIIPDNYQSVLFNTGSEGVETALKMARIYAIKKLKNKGLVVSFKNSYHGKMMATTAISGNEKNKYWISDSILNELSIQVPFPNCQYEPHFYDFSDTLNFLEKSAIDIRNICAFFIEAYQGGSCSFISKNYALEMQKFCHENNILLICDEVQSGVGRTGKMWAFEHLGIIPDIFIAAKGISASMPLSAVIGRKDLFELCEPGNFNTTHSGNPVCCAAAIANINYILNNKLVAHTEGIGVFFEKCLKKIQTKYPFFITYVLGKGLVYSIHINQNYINLLKPLLKTFIKNGLLLVSPGGVGGTTFKLTPPLIIDETGILQGCAILDQSILEVLTSFNLMSGNTNDTSR